MDRCPALAILTFGLQTIGLQRPAFSTHYRAARFPFQLVQVIGNPTPANSRSIAISSATRALASVRTRQKSNRIPGVLLAAVTGSELVVDCYPTASPEIAGREKPADTVLKAGRDGAGGLDSTGSMPRRWYPQKAIEKSAIQHGHRRTPRWLCLCDARRHARLYPECLHFHARKILRRESCPRLPSCHGGRPPPPHG